MSSGLADSDFQIVENSVSFGNGGGTIEVTCPAGFLRTGCSGTRHTSGQDNCDEGDCGYIGAIPIPNQGCRVAFDHDGGQTAHAYAYCIRRNY